MRGWTAPKTRALSCQAKARTLPRAEGPQSPRGPAEAPLSVQAAELSRWAAAAGRCRQGRAAPGWAEPLPQTLQMSQPRAALRAPLTGRSRRSGPQQGTTLLAPHPGPSTPRHSIPLLGWAPGRPHLGHGRHLHTGGATCVGLLGAATLGQPRGPDLGATGSEPLLEWLSHT